MGKGRSGRPRSVDVERRPGGKVRDGDRDIYSPFAMAKRAVLVDPRAAEAALNKAKDEYAAGQNPRNNRTEFSAEDAARAVARSVGGEGIRAATALGRYFLWSQYRGGVPYRLTEDQYIAGNRYATLHGVAWAGHRQDLAEVAAETGGILSETWIVVPNRHPGAHLGNMVAAEAPADFNPKPRLTPDERRDQRRGQWERYLGARDALLRCGAAVALAVEDLVVEDHDPWWIASATARLGEDAARARSANRALIRAGLNALVEYFGSDGPGKKTTAPHTRESKQSRRPRLPIVFAPVQTGDGATVREVPINQIAVASAIQRVRGEEGEGDG